MNTFKNSSTNAIKYLSLLASFLTFGIPRFLFFAVKKKNERKVADSSEKNRKKKREQPNTMGEGWATWRNRAAWMDGGRGGLGR